MLVVSHWPHSESASAVVPTSSVGGGGAAHAGIAAATRARALAHENFTVTSCRGTRGYDCALVTRRGGAPVRRASARCGKTTALSTPHVGSGAGNAVHAKLRAANAAESRGAPQIPQQARIFPRRASAFPSG